MRHIGRLIVRRALERAATFPVTPHFADLAEAINAALGLVLDRHESVARALRRAARPSA